VTYAAHREFRNSERNEQPIPDLLADITKTSEKLVRQEFELAVAELDVRLNRAKKDLGAAAVAAAGLQGAALCLLAGVILLLAHAVDAWLASLIVGVAVGSVSVALLAKARKDLKPEALAPRGAVRSIKSDVRTLKEATK